MEYRYDKPSPFPLIKGEFFEEIHKQHVRVIYRRSKLLFGDVFKTIQDKEQWESLYKKYLSSVEWDIKRLELLKQFPKCQCGQIATTAHHKTYENIGNERMEDLEAVCRKCHRIIHGKQSSAI